MTCLVRTPVLMVLLLPVLVGCAQKPEAKYPESLQPCDLLPRAAAVGVLDVGASISPAQAKETHFILHDKYCQWDYKQEKDSLWSRTKPGPVKRLMFIDVEVFSADRGGAPSAAARLEAHTKGQQAVAGIGEGAFWSTSEFQGLHEDLLTFRRSNALVTVKLSGRDCCRHNGTEPEMPAAKRKQQVLNAASAADLYLLTLG